MFNFFHIKDAKTIEPRTEILFIPEFKKLWERDETPKKQVAKNDLAIVYFLGYFNSPMLKYGDKMVSKVAEKFKGDSKWTPDKDKDIKAAIDFYQEMQNTPSLRILKSIRQGLEASDAVIAQVSKNITTIARRQDEETDDIKSLKNMEKLFSYITHLLKIQSQIPEAINSIVDLEKKVFDELSVRVRGGGSIGSREKPKRDGKN